MTTLRSQFADVFGRAAEIVASAPGRINVIGEHIDYNGGWVLPFAIGYRTHVAMARNGGAVHRLASVQDELRVIEVPAAKLSPDSSRGWVEYVLGVISQLGITDGIDILVDGNVPAGAGLSSSAALECATGTALNQLFGLNKSARDIALLAQAAENTFVGMPCGIMDQAVSMLAEPAHALLLDCETLETRQIPIDLAAQRLALLVIDTQAHHALVDGGYAERRASCESAASKLGVETLRTVTREQLDAARNDLTPSEYIRAHHAVTEIARVHDAVAALEAQDFTTLGQLLDASHASLRDDYTVSCPELDVAQSAAVAAGALGARMVGGGFGGSAIALVSESAVDAVKQAVSDAFAASGFTAPRFFIATPHAGAGVETD